jgi:hypothetical protein
MLRVRHSPRNAGKARFNHEVVTVQLNHQQYQISQVVLIKESGLAFFLLIP